MFATGGARGGPRVGVLLPLVVALIFCHGLFGGLHLISGSSGVVAPGDEGPSGIASGGHAQHVGSPQDPGGPQNHPAPHPGASDYYAAMLVAAIGVTFGLLLRVALGARGLLDGAARGDGFVPVAEAPVLARGPDRRALLQVFRL